LKHGVSLETGKQQVNEQLNAQQRQSAFIDAALREAEFRSSAPMPMRHDISPVTSCWNLQSAPSESLLRELPKYMTPMATPMNQRRQYAIVYSRKR
jgi:hypothetical protein